MDQLNPYQIQKNPKFIQFEGVYDYSVLSKILSIRCEREHEHYTKKNDKVLLAHDQ